MTSRQDICSDIVCFEKRKKECYEMNLVLDDQRERVGGKLINNEKRR